MATFQWAGFGNLMGRLQRLADLDPTPLLEEWEDIIEEDNRKGVLAGQDRDGNPMRPVTYRPVAALRGKARAREQARAAGTARGVFAGLGPQAAGLHGNLSAGQYRRLTGPPLAPRGPNSRVITNLFTEHGRDGDLWYAQGAWREVVTAKGQELLPPHFQGLGRNPKRDLRGVRPAGRKEAVAALERWAKGLLGEG